MMEQQTESRSTINLHLGNCLEAMQEMPDNAFELAIVDPPYGGYNDAIGLSDNSDFSKQATKRTKYKEFENTQPSAEYFNELKRVSKNQIIWGVNFYKGVDLTGGRICWDKKGTAFGRAELAYYSGSKSVNVVEITWNGMIQHDMKDKEVRIHNCQKPVKLYEWLLTNYAKEGDKILDTHGGSMSIALACGNLGFDLDCYELDPDYFHAAHKRIESHFSQLNAFQTKPIINTFI